jgi:hypothetical protein
MTLHAAILAVMLALLLCGCGPYAPTDTDATAWDREQFGNYFGLSDEEVQHLIDIGMFDPEYSCSAQVTVLPQRIIPQKQIADTLQPGTAALLEMMALLHATVPELYIDTGNTYAFEYEVTTDNLYTLLQDARDGKLAALCGEYAQFLKVMWQRSFRDAPFDMRIASMNRPQYAVEHTVNLVYWEDNGVRYGLVADAMYGHVFPVDDQGLPVPLDSLPRAEERLMMHLSTEVREAKRFLTDRIWPCNLVDPQWHPYHLASEGALRSYELLMPKDIALLYPQEFWHDDYERELLRLLLAARPR